MQKVGSCCKVRFSKEKPYLKPRVPTFYRICDLQSFIVVLGELPSMPFRGKLSASANTERLSHPHKKYKGNKKKETAKSRGGDVLFSNHIALHKNIYIGLCKELLQEYDSPAHGRRAHDIEINLENSMYC